MVKAFIVYRIPLLPVYAISKAGKDDFFEEDDKHRIGEFNLWWNWSGCGDAKTLEDAKSYFAEKGVRELTKMKKQAQLKINTINKILEKIDKDYPNEWIEKYRSRKKEDYK